MYEGRREYLTHQVLVAWKIWLQGCDSCFVFDLFMCVQHYGSIWTKWSRARPLHHCTTFCHTLKRLSPKKPRVVSEYYSPWTNFMYDVRMKESCDIHGANSAGKYTHLRQMSLERPLRHYTMGKSMFARHHSLRNICHRLKRFVRKI